MLAVTPVASVARVGRVDGVAQIEQAVGAVDGDGSTLDQKGAALPQRILEPPAMLSLATLCAAAICWTSMVWLAPDCDW